MTRRLLATLLAGATAAGALPAQDRNDPDVAAWAPHRSIRVLYAGWPDSSRQHAFAEFLSQWFDDVALIDLKQLSVATARDHDVVIADWASQYGNDGYPKTDNSLHGVPVKLGPEFTRPVIAMDYVSSGLRSGYKLDWL